MTYKTQLEKEFDKLSEYFYGIRHRKKDADYTEWKILQAKLEGYNQARKEDVKIIDVQLNNSILLGVERRILEKLKERIKELEK